MKKIIFFILSLLYLNILKAQSIERLFETYEVHTIKSEEDYDGGKALGAIYVNELSQEYYINHPYVGKTYKISEKSCEIKKIENSIIDRTAYSIGNYFIYCFSSDIFIANKENKDLCHNGNNAGISFILKKDNEYMVYFVDKNGMPGAIDTACNKYDNKAAMEYLKSYNPKKYEESRNRASQLGLLKEFDADSILIWGQTYYSTVGILKNFWKPESYLYPKGSVPIQYDLSGNGYQEYIEHRIEDEFDNDSDITIVSQDGKWLNSPIKIHDSSNILVRHYNEKDKSSINSEMVVGFSGNIYYYISDEKETEVFRIRNTWDSTNLYALAVNGYTEDEYGKYVNKVLPKLSKADLRLLRNTVFALYGVHFKSEDLSAYFDKQVWYTDEGKTSAEVKLPEHRQKLVQMIQALEK